MPIDQSLAEIQKLTQRLTQERHAFLRSLPEELGLSSQDDLIQEIRSAFSASRPTTPKVQKRLSAAKTPAVQSASTKATIAPQKAESESKKKRAPRTQITPEIRERVVEMIKQLKTANAIAAEVGISVQTVQNIKKTEKLVGKFNPPPHNKTTPPFPVPEAPAAPTKTTKAGSKKAPAKKGPPKVAAQ